jgi:hypothetical protein
MTFGMTSSADAHPAHGHGRAVVVRHAYRPACGVRFRGGYYYRVHAHPVWSACRWDANLRCNVYLDPGLNVWYYYSAPAACYYPVGYTCP